MTEPAPSHRRPHSSKMDLRMIARRAMVERGLLPDFSGAAMAEAAALREPAVDGALANSSKDLRDRPWVSIDNDDSLDLDQLSVAERLGDGATKIMVAIAEVAGSVAMGSAIDRHARTNTTSVYTAAQVFPMLPEKLSTDLTSLRQGADREAVVVEFVVRPDGSLESPDVYRALVRNHAKLAYDGVAAWLDGKAPAPAPVLAVVGIDEQIRMQDDVAQRLRKLRFEHGALLLETSEARAVFENDALSDLVPETRNRAKDLIEDFMIAANGVTARFLDAQRFPSLRRVLRSPERWEKIVSLAESVRETLPPSPSNAALQAFLVRRREAAPSRFADLSLAVVKLLGRGEYVLDFGGQHAVGHFGLALDDYTHSTAPNRRFPDLITQRLLKAALSGERTPYSDDELRALAAHCTEQEGNAAKVERRVRKSAAALLLSSHVGHRFDAFVTGASAKGTWVRIAGPAAEGKLVRGFHGLDVGDHVRVELVHTDFEEGFIDFVRA